jgi:hypothetical protein
MYMDKHVDAMVVWSTREQQGGELLLLNRGRDYYDTEGEAVSGVTGVRFGTNVCI